MPILSIEALLKNLDNALDFINAESEKIGFDKINLNRIRLASEEIIVNIINYAYDQNAPESL
jgi:anti-sigma regulatory factor (Ser/Thr protein kinase)